MGKTKQQLIVDNNTSFPNNNANYITPALLRDFNRDMIDNTVNQDVYTADSASFNQRINDITGSGGGGTTNTGSLLLTASFDNNSRNLTFTKGDSSTFAVNIPDVSGSVLETGSFATTGSNAFVGNQTISGGLLLSGSSPVHFSSSKFIVETFGSFPDGGIVFKPGTSIQFQGNTDFTNPGRFPILNVDASGSGYYGFNNEAVGRIYQDFSGSVNDRINAITASGGIPAGTVSSSAQITDYGIFATTGSNTFNGNQIITGSLSVNGSPSTFITNGNTDVTIKSTAISGQTNLLLDAFQNNIAATGNLFFNNYGQFGGSGSVKFISTLNNIEFASDNGTRIGPTNGGGNGINIQAISLQAHSGSLSLASQGFTNTTASLSHISSSSGTNFINLMFKNNNNAVTTIVSGSNNIFANPATVTSEFVRYVGGNNNFYPNVLPQLTGSVAFPITMNNNISNGGILMRLPVSSSAYTINSNIIAAPQTGNSLAFGSTVGLSMDKAQSGGTVIGNVLAGGAINMRAAGTILSSSFNINNNMIGGTANLNMDSSSVSLVNSSIQGSLTVNNQYFPTTVNSAAGIAINSLAVFGINNFIYASGSNDTFTAGRSIVGSGMMGSSNVISASFNGDNTNVLATTLFGHGLTVYGTNRRQTTPNAPDIGSTFIGRYNDLSGQKAYTAETVFAVGTGTSGSAGFQRKTGFLIDSGSNTFIEGSLNVSGSTTITGSVTISGSAQSDLTVVGQIFVSSSATTSATAPRITISGSAGRTVINRNGITITDATDEGGMFPSTHYAKDSATTDEIGFTVDSSVFSISGWTTGPSIYVNNPADTYPAVIGFQNKANYTDGRVTVLTPLVAQSGSIVSGSTTLSGSLTIQSGSGDLFMYGHKMFNAGAFQSNVTQSGSANVSQSVNFDTTDVSYGVTLSDNSRLNVVNAGTYLITFSLQVLADSGADTFYVWLKKNGANVPESASKLTLANNSAQLATVTFVVDVLANDYYEIAWQSTQGDAVLYTEAASGNIPAIPSAIITLTQVR